VAGGDVGLVMAGANRAGRWVLAAAIVALLGVAGCSESAEPVDDPRLEVRSLLSQRARALAGGDAQAYLATATGEAREPAQRIAEGVAATGMAQYDEVLVDAEVDAESGEVRDAEIDVVYRYEGVPENNQFRDRLTADFASRDGQWVMTDAEFEDPPPMWAMGPVEVIRSQHFLALFHPELGDPREPVALAEEGYRRLHPELTLDEQPLYVRALARDRAEMDALVDQDMLPPALARWEHSEAGMVQRVRAQRRQMVVNVGAVLPGGGDIPAAAASPAPSPAPRGHHGGLQQARETFQHELGHVVLLPFTYPHTPRWVAEAGAMYLAEERREATWRAGLDSGAFRDMSFTDLHEQELGPLHYAYANAAALYLVEQDRPATFWRFYRNFRDADSTAEAGRLLELLYGFDAEALDERTLAWMREAVASGG
jgi:hypothetical protein